MRRAALILFVFMIGVPLLRASEMKDVVPAIEQRYRVRHLRFPGLSFMAKLVPTPGVSGIGITIFEDFHFPANSSPHEAEELVSHTLGPRWTPFIRVHSKADGEDVFMYVRPDGNNMRMLMVVFESDDTVVMHMKLHPRALKKWLENPVESGREKNKHPKQIAKARK